MHKIKIRKIIINLKINNNNKMEISKSKSDYPPLIAFRNFHILEKYRYLDLIPGRKDFTKFSDEDIISHLQNSGFLIVEARPKKNAPIRRLPNRFHKSCKELITKTFIILIEKENNKGVMATDTIVKILNSIPGIKLKQREFNIDIIIVAENDFSTFVMKKLNEYKSSGGTDFGYIDVCLFKHVDLLFDKFDYCMVALHEIVPEDLIKKIYEDVCSIPGNFPKIFEKDAISKMIGARIGDVVRITNKHNTSGLKIEYREVI